MKKTWLLIAFSATTFWAMARQDKSIKPPAAVKAAFDKAYPGIAGTKWEKEEGEYEVTFQKDSKTVSVVYDTKGQLKETETGIEVSALPAAVVTYVNQHYKGATIKTPEKTVKADGTVIYEVDVNKHTLVFDAAGKYLKSEKAD